MIESQLGLPPVAAGRGGSVPTTGAAGENAAGAQGPDDGGFVTALDGHTTPPDSPDASAGAQDPNDAAGPLTGELPAEIVADADISPDATRGGRGGLDRDRDRRRRPRGRATARLRRDARSRGRRSGRLRPGRTAPAASRPGAGDAWTAAVPWCR